MTKLFRKLRSRTWRFSYRLLARAGGMLKWPFRLAASLCLSLGYLLRSWWKRRKLQQLLAGLPALLLIVTVSYLGIAIADQDDKLILAKYQRAAKSSMDGKDFTAAKLYLERLLEKRPGDREVLFDLARAAEHTRDYPRLASAMRLLAPEDHPVHGPSHLWQATRLLSNNPVTPKQIRLAESHLLHALTLRESVPVAHDLLGQMYFQLGLWSQAIPHLSASPDPSRRLLLAKAYVLDGQRDKGRSAGEQARDFFKREAIAHPQDAQLRINCAEACLLLEQYPEAVRVLQDALTMNDQIPIRRALARSYVMWADSLPEGTSNRRMQQFEMLAKGVQAYPDELSLYDRLLKLLENGQETGETVRQFLLTNIVEGRAVGLSHLILGSYAFGTGRADEAKLHMEQAFAALPNADLVANNLAWLMIHTDPPHPDQALALIDPVVERNPTMPRYLDTRGHILVKLNRYRDAVRDLELAVPSLRKNVSTHKALASAYQQLGLLDLAQLHQRAADEAGKGQN